MRERTLAVIAGGRTPEHDLSLDSAEGLRSSLAGTEWRPTLFAVHPSGEFPVPDAIRRLREFDYVLPLVHGLQGEGFHGLFEAFDIPVLGEGAAASAVALDKPLAKRLLRDAGLPIAGHVLISRKLLAASPREACSRVAREVGFPCFVKPASGVASVGTRVVWEARELSTALFHAASFDTELIVEPFLDAREIEVAVVGGAPSLPGELVYRSEHHDPATKRTGEGLELVIPAMVDAAERDRLRAIAVAACSALGIEVVGRVEILRDRNTRELFVNEVNALPSFRPGAVFNRLWEASGLPPARVLDRMAAACDARSRDRFRTDPGFAAPVRP